MKLFSFQFFFLFVLVVQTANSVGILKYKIDLGDGVVATGTLRTDEGGNLAVRIRQTYFPVHISETVQADFAIYRNQVLSLSGIIKVAGPYILFPRTNWQEYRVDQNRNIIIPNGAQNNDPIVIPVVKVHTQDNEEINLADSQNAVEPIPGPSSLSISAPAPLSNSSRIKLSSSATDPPSGKPSSDSSFSRIGKSKLNVVKGIENKKEKSHLWSSTSLFSPQIPEDIMGIVIRKEKRIIVGRVNTEEPEDTIPCDGRLKVGPFGDGIIQVTDEYQGADLEILDRELRGKSSQFTHPRNAGYQYNPFIYVCTQSILDRATSFEEIRANSRAIFGVKEIRLQPTEAGRKDLQIAFTWIETEVLSPYPYTHEIQFSHNDVFHSVIGTVDFRNMVIQISADDPKNTKLAVTAFKTVEIVTFLICRPLGLSLESDNRLTALGDKSQATVECNYISKKITTLGDEFSKQGRRKYTLSILH